MKQPIIKTQDVWDGAKIESIIFLKEMPQTKEAVKIFGLQEYL